MALTWVKIGNLKGPKGDSGDTTAMNRFDAIEAKDVEQDGRLGGHDTQLAGLTSAIRTRGTLPAGSLFALTGYDDNGIYSLNAATTYTDAPFTGSGSLTVMNDYQNPGMLMAQRDNTGEIWVSKNTTAASGSFTGWAQVSTTRGTELTTEHLDTVTAPGTYWQRTNAGATTALGYPFPAFGTLMVMAQHVDTANLTQVYLPNQSWGAGYAIRSRYNGVWGAWEFYKSTAAAARGTQLITEHLDTVTTPGNYWTRQNSEATVALGYPFQAYGNLIVLSASTNDANLTQIYYPSQRYGYGFAMRARYNTVWEEWKFFRPGGTAAGTGSNAASGFKITPLALTLGLGSGSAPTTRHYRLPVNFAAPIQRFRVHIRNWNPRLGTVTTGAVSFTGLWLGQHAGNGAFTAAPTQLRGAFTTPEDGSDWVSTWFSTPAGNLKDYLLSYGYTAPVAPQGLVGGCWNGTNPADASAINPVMGQYILSPFDMWLEAETPAATPVVGVIGDSLSCGVGSTLPVHDSVISQYARKIGALPYHLAASGDSMAAMLSTNPGKVTRWSGLAHPDSILWAVGSNDIALGDNLATLQTRYADLATVVSEISTNIYLADIMPRDTWVAGGPEETTRLAYNTWLRTLPGYARDVFGFAASISTDEDTITPAYNSDGTHLNTAGYAQNMAAIVRPITASAARDTGAQDITATATNVTSGQVTFQHKNGWNILTLADLKVSVAGTVTLFANNNTALKPWAPGVDGVSAGGAHEAVTLGTSGADYRRVTVNYTGGVTIYAATTADVLNGTVMWPMNRAMPY